MDGSYFSAAAFAVGTAADEQDEVWSTVWKNGVAFNASVIATAISVAASFDIGPLPGLQDPVSLCGLFLLEEEEEEEDL